MTMPLMMGMNDDSHDCIDENDCDENDCDDVVADACQYVNHEVTLFLAILTLCAAQELISFESSWQWFSTAMMILSPF